ncbi:alpha/beta hydrolase-fold protein [Rossellomorea sp. SC111]|uniref:alpha/beta hydrolase n=1 Tax=Rossellomorea sp. SC111 TaxID=2968985 RepID=UPI00215A5881|nr:alpha/beta hydrolase-fold protein [Rossellomorea sp. SC111]MCR8850493.1 alpha/beta hydrolase-fold protein [Rossellomorea sp. SC111]
MKASLEECVITSRYLRRDQRYYIHEYKRGHEETVDVLFVQDGMDYAELGEIIPSLDAILVNSESHHLVLVLIPPSSSEERYHFYHPKGKQHENYVRFFNEELLGDIRGRFNRNGKKLRKTGLLGDSLGAAVSMSIACNSPEPWSHLLLQSGAYTELHELKIRNLPKVSWRVYQVVGIGEESVTYPLTGEKLPILSFNRTLHSLLQAVTDTITYYEEDDQHLWDFWRRDLPRALKYFIHTNTKGERDE